MVGGRCSTGQYASILGMQLFGGPLWSSLVLEGVASVYSMHRMKGVLRVCMCMLLSQAFSSLNSRSLMVAKGFADLFNTIWLVVEGAHVEHSLPNLP